MNNPVPQMVIDPHLPTSGAALAGRAAPTDPLPGQPQAASAVSDPFAFESMATSEMQGLSKSQEIPLEEALPNQKILYAGVVILVIATLFGFYQILFNNFNPYDAIVNLFTGGDDPPAPEAVVSNPEPPQESIPEDKPEPVKPVDGNPYWILPNSNFSLENQKSKSKETWSIGDEAAIREALGHKFVYQHYKAVQDVRRKRWAGSEIELRRALRAKKFWTRMFAAIGLAEMGFAVSLAELDRSMAGERSELISGFFERFVDKPNAGQAYILRQVIRLADTRSRLILLEGIAKINDPLTKLYLHAATKDMSQKVQLKASKLMKSKSAESPQTLEEVISGHMSGQEYLKLIGVVKRERYVSEISTTTPASPAKIITDADIDKELNEMMEDPGEVEVYEFEEGMQMDK